MEWWESRLGEYAGKQVRSRYQSEATRRALASSSVGDEWWHSVPEAARVTHNAMTTTCIPEWQEYLLEHAG